MSLSSWPIRNPANELRVRICDRTESLLGTPGDAPNSGLRVVVGVAVVVEGIALATSSSTAAMPPSRHTPSVRLRSSYCSFVISPLQQSSARAGPPAGAGLHPRRRWAPCLPPALFLAQRGVQSLCRISRRKGLCDQIARKKPVNDSPDKLRFPRTEHDPNFEVRAKAGTGNIR